MPRAVHVKIGVGSFLALGGLLCVVGWIVSCGMAPTPLPVVGPGGIGNDPPTLTVLEPSVNITRGQGDPFLVRWTDTDRDNNAQISFSLISTTSSDRVLLIEGIDENDTIGPDSFTVPTTLIPLGSYNVLGTIDDGVNPPVQQYALVAGASVQQRVNVRIVGSGEGPQTVPPTVTVTEPTFDLSMTQDDVLTILVQPTALAPDPINPVPFDPDSDINLYVLLDFDLDPNNDDPANPDPTQIILLREQTVQVGAFNTIVIPYTIDLSVIQPRPDGEPYHIRATADDSTNPPVHRYAVGTISIVQLAAGTVDLSDIGVTRSGARFQGFSPGANLGSNVSWVSDFDADGIDDFILVAQFGNPQNVGPVGEAYLIYGRDDVRFGGTISANAVSDRVSGVVFQAPPVRFAYIFPSSRTDGIVDVNFLPDLSGDGRPELIFGLPLVHWAYDSTDYDPADEDLTDQSPFDCYPDFYVNNYTDQDDERWEDSGWYAGGMAVIVNSQNRDNDGLINTTRLESTVVDLELTGQFPWLLDGEGVNEFGNIMARADNALTNNIGNDPQEPGRISGARVIAGGFDYIFADQAPREGLFGQSVASLGDLNADGLGEIIISAPRNERYLTDLASESRLGTHWYSTTYWGSILILPGTNYNDRMWREAENESGTSITPHPDEEGRCSGTPPEPRKLWVPAETFEIYAEDIDDMLGGGRSAGDFNRDGLDDILCGAPLNDRSDLLADTGAVYIIYGRTVFGQVNLSEADDPVTRPPMLRIRGREVGDQLGSPVTAGLDVNGDRIDDVLIASPRTDFGNVRRSTCESDFNDDGVVNQSDLGLRLFDTCEADFGNDLFLDDGCKVFDYDNDGNIDDNDRCVFCCLSEDCEPDDTCVLGDDKEDCCNHLVDNGFVGIVFGGVFINGDRDISQLATSQLPGIRFYGRCSRDRAGFDVSSAGDFDHDGFDDLLITAPGDVRCDCDHRTEPACKQLLQKCYWDDPEGYENACVETQTGSGTLRVGVVYLIFGGPHLWDPKKDENEWNLKDVGTEELPGIVFLSPYMKGRPDEAAPTTAAYIGDINNDGFGDIAIGNAKADFVDPSFPQAPDATGTDPAVGRRSDVGEVYVIYGSNFGSNRARP